MRISRDEYYRAVVEAITLRGTCNRGMAGAVIVKQGRIVATGHVGSSAGAYHCDEIGHEIESRKHWLNGVQIETENCARTIHAELNAILQAARYGPTVEGAILYCTMFPCYECTKAIINVGIIEVKATYDYQHSKRSKKLFSELGIKWSILHAEVLPYKT
jgi:dCMP deaminase